MFKETAVFLTFIILASCGDPYQKCGDSMECVEQEMVKVVDGLDEQKEVPILGDVVVLEKVEGAKETGRNSGDLVERLVRYIEEHQVTLKLPQSYQQSRSLEEGTNLGLRILFVEFGLQLIDNFITCESEQHVLDKKIHIIGRY